MHIGREKRQKIKVHEVKKDSSHTEQSSYWNDVANRGDGGEHVLANPDSLPETEIATPSTPQLLMGEAISHLQGRQREVYILTMREDKSLAEASEILGISKGTAQKYRERAIKFISQYCKNAILQGRI